MYRTEPWQGGLNEVKKNTKLGYCTSFSLHFVFLAITELGLKTFHSKISLTNQPSIDLFTKKLGFYPVSTSQVFQETTLEWSCLPKHDKDISSDENDDDDEEERYGGKATDEQRKMNQDMRDSLIELYNTKIRKEKCL